MLKSILRPKYYGWGKVKQRIQRRHFSTSNRQTHIKNIQKYILKIKTQLYDWAKYMIMGNKLLWRDILTYPSGNINQDHSDIPSYLYLEKLRSLVTPRAEENVDQLTQIADRSVHWSNHFGKVIGAITWSRTPVLRPSNATARWHRDPPEQWFGTRVIQSPKGHLSMEMF